MNCKYTHYYNIKQMVRRKKIIKIPQRNLEPMMRAFNASRCGVFNALAYRSDSERAQMIRKAAIELYGGIETTKIIL